MFLSVIMILSPSVPSDFLPKTASSPQLSRLESKQIYLFKQNEQQGTERGADGPSTLAALQSK